MVCYDGFQNIFHLYPSLLDRNLISINVCAHSLKASRDCSYLYMWSYAILSSPVIYQRYRKKKVYVCELRLMKFSPLSREPFKEERVERAAGVRATGNELLYRTRPPTFAPPPGGSLPTPEAPPAPTPRPPRHCSSPHAAAPAASEVWRAAKPERGGRCAEHPPRAPLPAAPPPPTAEAAGAARSRGRARATPIPLPPALSALGGGGTLDYFNFSPQDARPRPVPPAVATPAPARGMGARGTCPRPPPARCGVCKFRRSPRGGCLRPHKRFKMQNPAEVGGDGGDLSGHPVNSRCKLCSGFSLRLVGLLPSLQRSFQWIVLRVSVGSVFQCNAYFFQI